MEGSLYRICDLFDAYLPDAIWRFPWIDGLLCWKPQNTSYFNGLFSVVLTDYLGDYNGFFVKNITVLIDNLHFTNIIYL